VSCTRAEADGSVALARCWAVSSTAVAHAVRNNDGCHEVSMPASSCQTTSPPPL